MEKRESVNPAKIYNHSFKLCGASKVMQSPVPNAKNIGPLISGTKEGKERPGAVIKNLPTTSGVYIFKDKSKKILYIGKAKNIKLRVSSYFAKSLSGMKTKKMVSQINSIGTIKTDNEFDALLLEASLIRKHLPPYNIRARDDKRPLYIKITKEDYPKILTTRKEAQKNALYFGPFPSSRIVRSCLRMLRSIFPYCTEKRIGKKPCFYSHIGLCNPCPNSIVRLPQNVQSFEKRRYRKNIRSIRRILEGKSYAVINELEKRMHKLSNKQQFEQANTVKHKLNSLHYLIESRTAIDEYLKTSTLYEDLRKEELHELANLLNLSHIRRIEGYDVSNTSGTYAVASMVVFVNGEPMPSQYRRFKIHQFNTQSDTAMVHETIERRLKHKEWTYPCLMLIDGGVGQISAALSAIKRQDANIPVVGLAKRYETLIAQIKGNKTYTPIRLPARSPSLKLLKRIRDEAHRFARSYHMKLRKKYMLY